MDHHQAEDLGLPRPLISLLADRGLFGRRAIESFLQPKLADLPSPFLMKDMDRATEIFLASLRNNHPVVIYGDYDVDGTCSIALLVTFLRLLNMQASWYLPNRLTEGYGLHVEAIERLAAEINGPALLITVDCGITACQEIEVARSLGFETIVTDHHLPPDDLPPAGAILNPKQQDCGFPFDDLAGVGVAFFFLIALRSRLVENNYWSVKSAPNLKGFLDLVALGTVADVMPLIHTNRILVRAGLEVLAGRSRPGLWALCEQAGINWGRVTTEDISYRLAPRINAAGRLGTPDLAVQLLVCKTATRAVELAAALEEANNQRKKIAAQALEKAISLGRKQVEDQVSALVLNDSWHAGIVGIVAAQLVDLYRIPVIIFADDQSGAPDQLKGSGRSVPGIHLYETLKECEEYIEQYGGHKMAAGLVIQRDNLENFTHAFRKSVARSMKTKANCHTEHLEVEADYRAENNDIFETDFLEQYLKLEPFGEANPEPIFRLDNPRLFNISTIREHLRFMLAAGDKTLSGIGFGLGEHEEVAAHPATLYFKLKNITFRGVARWEIHMVSIS